MMHPTPSAYAYRSWSDVARIAAEHFGIRAFRPGQRDLIEAALSGRDALGVLPTGGGKSLCFQLPSLVFDKTVVVVSPLLALMRDQNDKLAGLRIPSARLDSTLGAEEARGALRRVGEGAMDLVYVTPEGLRRDEVRRALAARGVSLFVVDEAHCISAWGHDFRPAYLGLRDAFEALGRPPVMALTATATEDVARDVTEQLDLRSPAVVRASCERPNLSLEVIPAPSAERKERALREFLARERGSGIVYTATVKTAERLWIELCARGEPVGRYHGELPTDVRTASQQAFLDGRYRVMVATKAFGMGIDKPDVRFVVHYEMPDSIESYAQETGRAGRDGREARGVLLYRHEDRRVQDFFLRGKNARAHEIERVTAFVAGKSAGAPLTSREIALATRVAARKVEVLLHRLTRAGVVSASSRGFVARQPADARAAGALLAARCDAQRARDRARLRAMMRFAESTECRWRQVMRYFGEAAEQDCGRCDRCFASGRVAPE